MIDRTYLDLFDARYARVKNDYAHANAGRRYGRPGALRTALRRLAAR
jgi:hypothetical protein